MRRYRTNMAIIIMIVYSVGMSLAYLIQPRLRTKFDFWFSLAYLAIGVIYSAYIGFKKIKYEPNDSWKEIVQWSTAIAVFLIPLLFILQACNN